MRNASSKPPFLEALLTTLVIVVLLVFTTWHVARRPVGPSEEELARKVEFLTAELQAVKGRLDRSVAREAVLQRETDVLRQANRLLREQESERQGELTEMQSELDFYRRLAGTGGAQSGLEVYRAELLPTGSERVFQFILTLTQNIRRASIISGRVRIDVEGILADRPVTLYWAQLSAEDQPEPAFRFKYFQQLEGYLVLPDSFLPTRLVVTLEAKRSSTPVRRHYDWGSALTEATD